MKRRLGVNIDHIATIRESRKVSYPDPFEALPILKSCQVDQVTIHLREDRRHIQDHDLKRISAANILPVNLEMAVTNEMLDIATQQKPSHVTFVPEKREEVTTEGGLDCVSSLVNVKKAVKRIKECGIHASLFIDPDCRQIAAAKESGADAIEIHTGTYCNVLEDFFLKNGHYDYSKDAVFHKQIDIEITKIQESARMATEAGLKVYAGHGLHVDNLQPITNIPQIEEYNIGHALIARAVFVGLKQAITEIQMMLRGDF
jgi:pyridoxine 5-phosphate synthase